MKKVTWGAGLVFLAILAMNLGFFAAPASASLNNFYIKNYDIDYKLSRDENNRSTLEVKETIKAHFPNANQNRGIERNFVKKYENRSTKFKLQSVTDENGNNHKYKWTDDTLRIGDANKYVHGDVTYVITYTQNDVTKFYEDTGKAEFYWNAIGTDWRVPIEKATVTLNVDPSIEGKIATDLNCYYGRLRQNNSCNPENKGDLQISVDGLKRFEGVTIALGFEPGTFAEYEPSLLDKALEFWLMVQIPLTIIALIFLALMSIVSPIQTSRKRDARKTVVPEYLPPKGVSVTAAANIGARYRLVRGSVFSAQLIDLAVRHYIKLYEISPKAFLRRAQYELEIVRDLEGLLEEEKEIISDMFGLLPAKGERLNMRKLANNEMYHRRTLDNEKKLKKLMDSAYGLKAEDAKYKKQYVKGAKILLVIGVLTLSPAVLIASLIIWVMSKRKVVTDKGLELYSYLKGLKMYIGVAEQDRIKMLQSPEGASKIAEIETGEDDLKFIKLYERVLPYAVLFGQEKEWTKQLGRYYEQNNTQPDWHTGTSAFNAAYFASAMSDFSSAARSYNSAPSSSGGSSGGGFSGGGGGGGGGGGW